MKSRTLLYFTNSYPYGLGEQWKTNELNTLVKYFKNIKVVPYNYDGNFDQPKQLPEGVELIEPLFKEYGFKVKKIYFLKILFHRYVASFIEEFFRSKVYRNRRKVMSWLSGSLNVIRLGRNAQLTKLLAEADQNSVLYFYWGKGSCEILPFINTRKYFKTFVRMHRYDLFENVNNNYIPYRRGLLNKIDFAAPSSLSGKLHLKELYPTVTAKIEVVRCGTLGNGKISGPSKDNVLRVVSCSLLSPVKRVHLMIECLQFIDFPILWRHIGDGEIREELKALVEKLGFSDKFIFEGRLDSSSILDLYTKNVFDVFVNVSESEGVPFSIMEAFSVGIPVIATDVGGTSEIVNDQTGVLVPKNLTAKSLAKELTDFYARPLAEREIMRDRAYGEYRNSWDANKLTEDLAQILNQ